MKTKLYLPLFLMLALVAVGCDSDDPDDDGPGEEELITTVTLTLSPQGGGTDVIAIWRDPNGDGSNVSIDDIDLVAGTTYTGSIELRDDLNGEDITEEIEEEDDEHQFWYSASGAGAGRLAVTINDTDGNGLPLGLDYTVAVSAGDATTASMNVVLSHYDDAPKDGVTQSDESDIDITFTVNIAAN
ncbi:MAG: type 1 periplasmic binding fold superfamily protein [Bacteroidota bacterium]